VRAVDLYPERTRDEILFERAAVDDRVFVTNDRPAEAITIRWLLEGRRFRGMVAWPVETYEHRSIGDVVEEFEALARGQSLRLSRETHPEPVNRAIVAKPRRARA
jgi:hypothetical protein